MLLLLLPVSLLLVPWWSCCCCSGSDDIDDEGDAPALRESLPLLEAPPPLLEDGREEPEDESALPAAEVAPRLVPGA